MRKNMTEQDLLLRGALASDLYHDCAAGLPVTELACRLDAREIAEDRQYSNITELWLARDTEKQRMMRACGVPEEFITGAGSDYEKFRAYCACAPRFAGNPLFLRGHLELRRYFDCELALNEENCDTIWALTAERLREASMSARGLLLATGVKELFVLADPAEDLSPYHTLAAQGFDVRLRPVFCPDRALDPQDADYPAYLEALGLAGGVRVCDLASLCLALVRALDRFAALGCRAALHSGGGVTAFCRPDPYHAELVLQKAMRGKGKELSSEEVALFFAQLHRMLGREYVGRGMVMQYRVDAVPQTAKIDPVRGEICCMAQKKLFSYLEKCEALPRVLITSGTSHAAFLGAFCGELSAVREGAPRISAGITLGRGDTPERVRAALRALAGECALGAMLAPATDAAGLLDLSLHEYFRRVLCDLLADLAESGEAPRDPAALCALVRAICEDNIQHLFFAR